MEARASPRRGQHRGPRAGRAHLTQRRPAQSANIVFPDADLTLVSARQMDRVLGYIEAGQSEGAALACGRTRANGENAGAFS
jgi:hypothetical protein